MRKEDKPHHLTEVVMLHVEAHQTHCVSRPPLPVQQMYPMDRVENRLYVKPQKTKKAAEDRSSMFFRGSKKSLDSDPFLQRLSRLN
jgi:hypothetical protein